MTNFVINDLKATIDRASRDYDTLRQSVSAVDRAVCRAIEHARAASEVLGTEGFLAYFEEAKSNGDPDAVELLNRLASGYNDMMTGPDSIASVSRLFDCFSYSSLTSLPFTDAGSSSHACRGRRTRLEPLQGKILFRQPPADR